MAKSEGRINKAQENVHREHIDRSKLGGAKGKGSDVGAERHANMRGVLEGGSRAEGFERPMLHDGLKGAVGELHRQHPHKHDDHGPHHGGMEHHRHEPVGKVYR